jgi:16S rRNA (adenine1518-N6/adenine1519-N6)-dimethyltransferase
MKEIVFIENDAMRIDYNELNKEHNITRVVSNLPYKVAAPLMLKILIEAPEIRKMYFTIQKDIAERLLAKPGDKGYSSYCVKANFLADFKTLFQVPRNCFMPVPNIDSNVIEVTAKDTLKKQLIDNRVNEFFSFIDNCFLHRRKKLVNSLQQAPEQSIVMKDDLDKKVLIVKMLHGIGKGPDIRAEDLTIQEFIMLFLSIYR